MISASMSLPGVTPAMTIPAEANVSIAFASTTPAMTIVAAAIITGYSGLLQLESGDLLLLENGNNISLEKTLVVGSGDAVASSLPTMTVSMVAV